ncbi:hypothetical protein LJR220_005706 [Bradyrhizobium sp. LjRoot220]|uniref:hypothetical protein n=1 Tax=Bradyrhizobium sp. LjRoot220 TaxID=3342284 RepID=UPI003ECDAC31
MPTEHGMQGNPSDIRRIPPLEFLLLRERIVREARIARAAAIGDAVGRVFAAATRGVRLLSSVVHDAFALRDLLPARERRRTGRPNQVSDN